MNKLIKICEWDKLKDSFISSDVVKVFVQNIQFHDLYKSLKNEMKSEIEKPK